MVSVLFRLIGTDGQRYVEYDLASIVRFQVLCQLKFYFKPRFHFTEDDWHIGRFSLLSEHLRSLTGDEREPLYEVTTRDRETDATGTDPVLSTLDESDFRSALALRRRSSATA